jgi:acyl-CoA thioesterase FadM
MTDQRFTSRVVVRPADLDSLGHVNNARLLEFLEAARWDWLHAQGVGGRSSIAPVVSSIVIDFLAQIRLTQVDVETVLRPLVEPELDLTFRVHVEQKVRLAGPQTLVAQAQIQIAFVNIVDQVLCPVADFLASHPEARLGQYLMSGGSAP